MHPSHTRQHNIQATPQDYALNLGDFDQFKNINKVSIPKIDTQKFKDRNLETTTFKRILRSTKIESGFSKLDEQLEVLQCESSMHLLLSRSCRCDTDSSPH